MTRHDAETRGDAAIVEAVGMGSEAERQLEIQSTVNQAVNQEGGVMSESMQTEGMQSFAARMEETVGGRADVGAAMGNAGRTVKDGIIGSLKGINEIEAEIVTLVRDTVANSIRATGNVSSDLVTVTRDVVKGAIAATEEVGTGLTLSTKSVAKGVIMGVSDVGGDIITAASSTVRAAVQGAADVGADVGLVARRAIDGSIEAASEVGGNVIQVAQSAGNAAIEAAGSIGNTAVSAVREVLLGLVGGVKDVAGAALPRPSQPQVIQPVAET